MSMRKKSTAKMLLILNILNYISKENNTFRIVKKDLVKILQQQIDGILTHL